MLWARVMDQQEIIVFEQPANENIRLCLRFEYLHNKALFFLHGHSQWESRCCVNAIIELLHLLDRPDLRNKIAQEITRIQSNMKRLQQTPQVNHAKLDSLIQEFNSIARTLHQNNGKFGDSLRLNDFIMSIYHLNNAPGGTCESNAPKFHLWLEQSPKKRMHDLAAWLDGFNDIYQVTSLLLNLVRQSAMPVRHIAKAGFYQTSLDAQTPCQLIRVQIPMSLQVFPKISCGRHGVNIRFLGEDFSERSQQTEQDIEFDLACCIF